MHPVSIPRINLVMFVSFKIGKPAHEATILLLTLDYRVESLTDRTILYVLR
tara:strand:+ start:124 stop:276 length:153 start_codon:yes stop_codon:yes gene_type:complete